MKPAEVKKAIAAHPSHAIYIRIGDSFIQYHAPSSKTAVIRNAKHFQGFRSGTYLQERPDLDQKRVCNGNQKIITFYQVEVGQ